MARRMWRNALKVAGATILYGVVHSALASRGAKRAFAEAAGPRRAAALYRPLYNAQAVASTALLVAYALRLEDETIYEVRGPLAGFMQALRLASLLHLAHAAYEVGVLDFLGAPGVAALVRGEPTIERRLVGQGPALERDGRVRATGPFRLNRHPLNAGTLPVLWLRPRMTANLLAFNTVTTVYMVLGSLHEEVRLREAYGEAYEEYRRSGVPFLVPGVGKIPPPSHQ